MNIWLAMLTFAGPILIAYKHTQQAALMLEGWAQRRHLKIGDGMKILIADRARTIALVITVSGAEAAMGVIAVRHDQITSPLTIALLLVAGLVCVAGAVLTARATLLIYDRFEH